MDTQSASAGMEKKLEYKKIAQTRKYRSGKNRSMLGSEEMSLQFLNLNFHRIIFVLMNQYRIWRHNFWSRDICSGCIR